MQKSASNQYTQRTVPGTAQVRGFADVDADVTVNGTWRYPNLGGPAAPTSPQSGATSAAPAAQTSYFYGGDDADNASFPVFKELAIEAVSAEDEISSVTGTGSRKAFLVLIFVILGVLGGFGNGAPSNSSYPGYSF